MYVYAIYNFVPQVHFASAPMRTRRCSKCKSAQSKPEGQDPPGRKTSFSGDHQRSKKTDKQN